MDNRLLKAFDRTEVLDKADLFKNIKSPLPTLMLLFPENSLRSTEGVIDHVVIRFTKTLSPGTMLGERYGIKVLSLPQEDILHIDWSCLDSKGIAWHGGMGVTASGEVKLSHEVFELHKSQVVKTEDRDKLFIKRMRNIALQTLLCLCFKPELITEVEDTPINTPGRGFHPKSKNSNQPHYLLPRWLGKNYQHQTAKSDRFDREYHVSGWWRKGFWRNQPYGSRKEPSYRPTWIEPTWCQPGE